MRHSLGQYQAETLVTAAQYEDGSLLIFLPDVRRVGFELDVRDAGSQRFQIAHHLLVAMPHDAQVPVGVLLPYAVPRLEEQVKALIVPIVKSAHSKSKVVIL